MRSIANNAFSGLQRNLAVLDLEDNLLGNNFPVPTSPSVAPRPGDSNGGGPGGGPGGGGGNALISVAGTLRYLNLWCNGIEWDGKTTDAFFPQVRV